MGLHEEFYRRLLLLVIRNFRYFLVFPAVFFAVECLSIFKDSLRVLICSAILLCSAILPFAPEKSTYVRLLCEVETDSFYQTAFSPEVGHTLAL
jgi:hypothetical protein